MRDRWPEFAAAVAARLEAGRVAYGDRSFSRPAEELAGEIEEEILDVCAWSFILWVRLRGVGDLLAFTDDGRKRPEMAGTKDP